MKENKRMFIIIIILIILVVGLVGYIIYDKILKSNSDDIIKSVVVQHGVQSEDIYGDWYILEGQVYFNARGEAYFKCGDICNSPDTKIKTSDKVIDIVSGFGWNGVTKGLVYFLLENGTIEELHYINEQMIADRNFYAEKLGCTIESKNLIKFEKETDFIIYVVDDKGNKYDICPYSSK